MDNFPDYPVFLSKGQQQDISLAVDGTFLGMFLVDRDSIELGGFIKQLLVWYFDHKPQKKHPGCYKLTQTPSANLSEISTYGQILSKVNFVQHQIP